MSRWVSADCPAGDLPCQVFVEVGTSRNQRPRFAQPRYDIAIRENAAPNSPVIAVTAEDPDGPDSALR